MSLPSISGKEIAILCVGISFLICSPSQAAQIVGGSTTFTGSMQAIEEAGQFGVSAASAIGPATLNLNSSTFVLPIAGGNTTTQINYAGGISITAPAFGTSMITDFVLHLTGTNANVLTVSTSVPGDTDTNVPIADVNPTTNLFTLDPRAAQALEELGGPNLGNFPIATGITQLQLASSSTVPEPGELGLVGLGLIGVVNSVLRRSRKKHQVRVKLLSVKGSVAITDRCSSCGKGA